MTQLPAAPEVRIRPMRLEDVPRVHVIDRLCFSLPWTERSYIFEITENINSSAWVAEVSTPEGGYEIAGMVVNWIILDEAHVATLGVHPDFRRLRIGQRLLAHSLIEAWKRGARIAFLEVRRGNLNAQALYERFGFEVVGERPRYYKDNNEDALLMTLERMQVDKLKALETTSRVSAPQSYSGER